MGPFVDLKNFPLWPLVARCLPIVTSISLSIFFAGLGLFPGLALACFPLVFIYTCWFPLVPTYAHLYVLLALAWPLCSF